MHVIKHTCFKCGKDHSEEHSFRVTIDNILRWVCGWCLQVQADGEAG